MVNTNTMQSRSTYGYWTVVSDAGLVDVGSSRRRALLCRCICGKTKIVLQQSLHSGKSLSCGCGVISRGNTRIPIGQHIVESPVYVTWRNMLLRCYKKDNIAYRHYGGRGISVCHEWRNAFREFERWALANGYSPLLSLDRRNNDGNYEPSNCRWVTKKQQARNTRRNAYLTAFGETKTVAEWTEDPRCSVNGKTLYVRIKNGITDETALKAPLSLNVISAFGVTKAIKEWANDARCTVTYKVLWQRLNNGVAPEEAISGKRNKVHYSLSQSL